MAAIQISQRSIQQASKAVSVRRMPVDVAHRGAQLIVFVDDRGDPLSWEQVAYGLAEDADFCQQWNQTWADLPFDFEWKPVPIHPYTAKSQPFFVVVFPAKFRPADPSDFADHLDRRLPGSLTVEFDNFSGDARLLVPANTGDYGHIAAFCRRASPEAQRALWWQAGKLCRAAISAEKAVWCNTHGHGVPWLHVRFDRRLKYSAFEPRGSISANSQAIWYKRIYHRAMDHRAMDEPNYTLRTAAPEDESILWTMLMHAAHEMSLEPLQTSPALARYVQNWGRAGDVGVIAVQSDTAIGAAWLRLSVEDAADNKGYGYVDENIPELAIAVVPEARSHGVGTNLLVDILALAQKQFPAVSLSVRGNNPAVHLYQRFGFQSVTGSEVKNRTGGTSFTMVRTFD
ncbi:MAG: N-acetyltransferase [Cyanobacteria bacterium P01_F01_bin.53]